MSEQRQSPARAIWLRSLVVWAILIALLGLSWLAAYGPFGGWTVAVNFGIAAAQATLVAVLFMRLNEASALVRLAAVCGLFWASILFALTLSDTFSRLANV
ncbi:cytochrome C oxidase subunit IV family protein [Methylobacterium gnaphalii]|uniref:Oxidase n=1 Tax=Methylobacterium gnaphalii TaxID=1010610 RepID=A0A512JGH5_9HYPH|nr:cytochrome C oxidase subunit IV family protein [Methylobacterium gnaphalii]GEP09043.1 hypothetical protein MGN01_08880 [Methylobacterium gnaphalii]GJD68354.1 hypothetical protein MMMDOFMJ_1277 [Methylobacterium gnaphalii]GLS48967.1 hypothetical protein GCM10007885_18140 [Methylobacterium gnaphalii]